MVLPQPRHRGGILVEPLLEREWLAVWVHRQRRTACGIHPEADDLVGPEAAHVFLRIGERLLDADLRALDVIGGMLAGEVWVARQDYARGAVFVIPNRRADFLAVGGIDD